MILGDASSSTLGPASDDFLFPSPNAPRGSVNSLSHFRQPGSRPSRRS
jgi:hypothetical protein